MTPRKTSPQNPELPGLKVSSKGPFIDPILVNQRSRRYKGGRVLRCAIRFRYWRETEGLSVGRIAARLEERTREYGMDAQYIMTRLYELEQGRFKPPMWLIGLLAEVYQIKFPWWEFLDSLPEAKR